MATKLKSTGKSSGNVIKRPSITSQSSSDEMTAEEMRNVLYERLHNKGLLDTLKSQLRDYMVAELSGRTSHPRTKSAERCLEQRLLDSLIYKYLCDTGCDYTVGVFLPETGITKREVLSADEMGKLLNLPKSDPKRKGDSSLLQLAITSIMSAQGADRATERHTQTDSHTLLLSDKLSHIDSEFSARPQSDEASASVEERLLSHQRRIELACSQKAQQDLERWKRLEMETMQITERERIQREMQDRRRQLEEEYRRKVQAITDREKALSDSVKTEFEAVQRDTYQQRQQLLQQTDQLRHREKEISEERSHLARLQRANEEKIVKLESVLKKREAEIERKELNMDNMLRTQQERCRLEEQLAYESKNRELKAWEERLKDKESSLEREKRSMLTNSERKELLDLRLANKEQEKQISKYSLEVSGLEMGMIGLQERLAKMFDYEVLKESNISLKKDLEVTKDRLDSLNKEHHFLQEKYEHMMIDGKEKAGFGEIMLIKTQIQKERDKVLDEKVLLEHRLKEMDVRFHEQIRKNEALMREFELQTERQKYMNKEYSEIRKQMGDSKVDSIARNKQGVSIAKDPSFYDTSFRRSGAPELSLDADWLADVSSGAEVSTATEESIVTETRRRLENLTEEAENLHSAFKSINRHAGGQTTSVLVSPSKPRKATPTRYSALVHSSVDIPISSHYISTLSAPSTLTTGQPSQLYPSMVYTTAENDSSILAASTRDTTAFTLPGKDSLSQADQFNRPTPNKQPMKESELNSKQPPAISPDSSPHARQPLYSGPSNKPYSDNLVSSPAKDDRHGSADISRVGAISLDSQWKTTDITPTSPVSHIRAASPSTNLLTSLDNHWQSQPQHATAPTSLDAQWSSKSMTHDTGQRPGESGLGSAAQKPKEDSMAGIDPVMQKYMQMVQQQKKVEQEKSPAEVQANKVGNDEEQSISEHMSLAKSDKGSNGGGATDDDFW